MCSGYACVCVLYKLIIVFLLSGAFSYIFLRFRFSRVVRFTLAADFGTVPFSLPPKLYNVCT